MKNEAKTNDSSAQKPSCETLQQEVLRLKKENALLDKKLSDSESLIQELDAQIQWMKENIGLMKKKIFGASSEKTVPEQLSFFNEAEACADETVTDQEEAVSDSKKKKKRGKRKLDLSALPLETKEYDLDPKEKICEVCGTDLHKMSQEVRTELIFVPASFKVVEHVRFIYACRSCEKHNTTTPIKVAAAPLALLPKSPVSASMLAGIINGKYVNALPLYRQEKEFLRQGICLPRQNMANWIIKAHQMYFEPIYQHLKKTLLTSFSLHVDETSIQVLREVGRKPTSKSFMWYYGSGEYDIPICLFEYQETREAIHPQQFLADFKGAIHTDGYSVYHALPDDILVVGCFVHARRYFHRALESIDPKKRQGTQSQIGFEFCNKLFKIEREIKDKSIEEKRQIRRQEAQPILIEFRRWLLQVKPLITPNSKAGEAINYALNQWQYLIRYLRDGRLNISNNLAENQIRPFVIGRKNSLFCTSPNGAKASACVYSLIQTALANQLKPYEYLHYLLTLLPNTKDISDPAFLDSIMPWSTSLPQECFLITSPE